MSLAQSPPVASEEAVMPLSINDILPDVCLGRIFQLLPLADKFRIMEVCRRWHELSDLAWVEPKELDLRSKELPAKAKTLKGVDRVLQKCGPYLESLIFGSRLDGILPVIARDCPKITSIEAYCDFEYWCHKLSFPKLKSLKIEGGMGNLTLLPVEIFRALPNNTMIEIDLYECNGDPDGTLPVLPRGVLSNFCQLEKITLAGFTIRSEDMSAMSRLSTLKCIDLCLSLVPHQLPSFALLTNLEKLDLGEETDVKDHDLIEIVNTCTKLRSLKFSSDSATNRGLSSLKFLPKLEVLRIEFTDYITDVPLATFHNLISLNCGYCKNVNDPGIIQLLLASSKLEWLSIRGTSVTKKVVEVANKVAKERTNDFDLRIELDLSSVDWPCVDEKSPLLGVEIWSGNSYEMYPLARYSTY